MADRDRYRAALTGEPPPGWLGPVVSLAVVAVATGLIYPLKSVAPAVSLGIVYIPGVLLVSVFWGWRQGLLAALLSAAAFNFFHLPPTGRLAVGDNRDVVALVVFAIAAVAAGSLAGYARARAEEAERRREEASEALRRAEELARQRDEMEAEAIEAEALRRGDELKTALLRSVSHDLRTPLTSIIAAGGALDSDSVTAEERRELSESIVESGQRLSKMVGNLLDVSRLESGNAEPHREPVALDELFEAARASIGAGGEEVRLALDEGLPPISADPTQLERAFANLLDNGVRHGAGHPVLVRSRLIGERVTVRVVDQGAGIPEPMRARIFEPFYQGGGGGQSSGAGLGLAIARGFIEANGGEIEVESLPGQGTSFVVSFELGEGGA